MDDKTNIVLKSSSMLLNVITDIEKLELEIKQLEGTNNVKLLCEKTLLLTLLYIKKNNYIDKILEDIQKATEEASKNLPNCPTVLN